jgi:hypothetical protein
MRTLTIKMTDAMYEDIETEAAKRKFSIYEVIHEWLFEGECTAALLMPGDPRLDSSPDFYTDEAIAKEDHGWDEARALRLELESLRPVQGSSVNEE